MKIKSRSLIPISIMLYFQPSKMKIILPLHLFPNRVYVFPFLKRLVLFCWNKSLGFTCIYYGFVREEIKWKRADDHVHVQISSVTDIIWAVEDTRHSEPLKWYGTLTVQSWPKIFDRLKPNRNPIDPILNFSFFKNSYGRVSMTFAEYKINKQSEGQNSADHMSYARCSLKLRSFQG